MSIDSNALAEITSNVAQRVYEQEVLNSTEPGGESPILDWESLPESSKNTRIQRSSNITEIVANSVIEHLVQKLEELYAQQTVLTSDGQAITDNCKEFYNSAIGDAINVIQTAINQE